MLLDLPAQINKAMPNTNKEISFSKELSDFIFVNKYARYNPLAERRETWEECVERSYTMHHNKFRKILSKEDMAEVKWAFQMVKDKRVVPSMRSAQYAGIAIEKNNSRIFNCSMRHVDSPRAFAEIMFLLMSGCGVGFTVYKKFMNRLPDLVQAEDKTGTVLTYVIDDSLEGWADSMEALLLCYFRNTAYTGRKIVFDYSKIRKKGTPLKTSSGLAPGHLGLRETHIKIKALLDYLIEEKHLTRLRPIDAYDIIMHQSDAVLSGGQRRSATVCLFEFDDQLMMEAKTNFKVDKHTKFIFDDDTNTYCGKVTVKGKKYEVELTEYEYNDMLLKDNTVNWKHIEPQRARSNNSVRLIREETTQEQFNQIIANTKQMGEPGFMWVSRGAEDTVGNPCLTEDTLITTKEGIYPIKDLVGKSVTIWDGNNWVPCNNFRVTGINQPLLEFELSNGAKIKVTPPHSMILADSSRIEARDIKIGDKLMPSALSGLIEITVIGIKEAGIAEKVYCCTVNSTHSLAIAAGIQIGQCMEVQSIPLTADQVAGVQNCNLSSMNGVKIKTVEDFKQATKAAVIIGTLQAAYTDFKFLGKASKDLTEAEALLGVSITGMMDSPDILLNPDNLKQMSLYACEVNELWAKKISINPSARITCIKPEGHTGVLLESASGIHPHHSHQYFRRVQCNKVDPVYKYFKKHNPHMCEESVWSANKTDDVVCFPLSFPKETIVKADLTAIKHLEIIKTVYQNWVIPGTSKYNKKPITHNVSCTVIVKDEEWDEVTKYLFENKQYFAAVSLIPACGDKLYKQAPLEAITTEDDKKKWDEIVKNYKHVDYTKLTETDDNTKIQNTISCAGGACEII